MSSENRMSPIVFLEVFRLCKGKEQKESDMLPAAQGEHTLFEAESFCIHALIEKAESDAVTVELIALPPHSIIYNGKILRLSIGESAEYTFHGETKSGESETARVCVSVQST